MAHIQMGKVLVVNLTNGTFTDESIPEKITRQYYGGYGLGVWYIYKNIEPGCDPLGPKNILGFCPGLLTGSPAHFTGRYIVCGKSPLTGKGKTTDGKICSGGWGNANSGGYFGPSIRKAGYDGIFFKGASSKPVYLLIDGDNKELVDAGEIWGKDIVETEKALHGKHGSKFKISAIGPAGEKVSLIAGVVNDSGRIAGRSGLGAVMGSKKLKALCLSGKTRMEYADKDQFMTHVKAYGEQFKSYAKKGIMTKVLGQMDALAPIMRITKMGTSSMDSPSLPKMTTQLFSAAAMGTTALNVLSAQNGDMPIKNHGGVGYKDFPLKTAKNLSPKILKGMMKKQYGCFACPSHCGAILEYEGLPYEEKETHRPEYETCGAFGGLILNGNMDLLLKANEYLNRAGMDSISAGNTISYVYECVEQGLLKKEDFKCAEYPDGFVPTWADQSYMLKLLEMMVSREGIGDKLADGTKMAGERIEGTAHLSMAANGQEIPMHDARLDPMLGVTYIADPTPGRHTAASLSFEGMGAKYFLPELGKLKAKTPNEMGEQQAITAKFHQTIEANGFCYFGVNHGKYPYLEIINAATGWDVDFEELQKTGHRIQTLRQMFNAREGAIRHEIPQRAIGSPPLKKGPLKGNSYDIDYIAKAYYEAMGYESNGVPKEETLKDLDLYFALSDHPKATGTPESLVNEYLQEKTAGETIGKSGAKPLRGG